MGFILFMYWWQEGAEHDLRPGRIGLLLYHLRILDKFERLNDIQMAIASIFMKLGLIKDNTCY